MASMNYVSASDVGGKMKTAGAVKASIRHDDKDERIKMKTHKNEFIDKTLTPDNVDFLGLSYKEKCKRFDNRIRELDETTNTNKRKDRVLAFGLHTTIPDTLSMEEQIAFAQDIVGLYADKYGRENIVSADFHQDEGHDYVDSRTHKVVHSMNGLHMTIIPEIDGSLNGKDFSSRKAMKEMNRAIDEMAREKYHVPYLKFEEHEKGDFKSVEELQRMTDAFCQEREVQLEQAQKTIDEAKAVEAISQDVVEGNVGHNVGLGTVLTKDEMRDVKKALAVSERLIEEADALRKNTAELVERGEALYSYEMTIKAREDAVEAREGTLSEREANVQAEIDEGVLRDVERLRKDERAKAEAEVSEREARAKAKWDEAIRTQDEALAAKEKADYIVQDVVDLFSTEPVWDDYDGLLTEDEKEERFMELYPEAEAVVDAHKSVVKAREDVSYSDILYSLPPWALKAVNDVVKRIEQGELGYKKQGNFITIRNYPKAYDAIQTLSESLDNLIERKRERDMDRKS